MLTEIRSLINQHHDGRGARGGQAAEELIGLRLRRADQPTAPANVLYEPSFALIAQGAKRTVCGDSTFDYGAGQYLVVSVELPIVSHVFRATPEEPYLAVGFTLKPAAIAALLLDHATSDRADAAGAGLAVSNAGADLLDPILRMLRLLDSPKDIPVLAPLMEREILWRLLAGEQGATVRQIGLADSRLSRINRAIRWICQHYAAPLKIGDLADIAGMSESTFFRHFRAVTAMSALQYQKRVRLQEARARLVSAPKAVAEVGFDVGYDSPSQFSREYSRLFGVPPGEDMKRLRSIADASQPTRAASGVA